jgi:CMP/dCMP kinase
MDGLTSPMIVAIDGPAGAGKSSAAQALARRLDFDFLDTGAMYRAVTLAALRAGLALHDQDAFARLMDALRLETPPGRVLLDGVDVSAEIRVEKVTKATGAVADSPVVRRRLGEMQRAIARGRRVVTEGRDQGTVVFPDAFCKFFLSAAVEERARRRQAEMAARGEAVELAVLLPMIEARDRRDAARELAPMVPAADAIVVDGTGMSLDQVVDRMEAEVLRRLPPCGFSRGCEP